MDRIRIALAQVNPTVGDLEGNVRLCEEALDEARRRGAALVAFPELVVTGYPPEDLVLSTSFLRDQAAALEAMAASVRGIGAVVGFIDSSDQVRYNAAALVVDGRVAGVYHKHVLPNYGVFDEKRYFAPGDGILLARLGSVTIGITICEDVWSPKGPHRACRAAGADVIVNLNGSPYHRGKGAERQRLILERVRELGAAFAYVNMVGGQDELVFDGQSFVISADGLVLARAGQFAEEILVADVPVATHPVPGALRTAGAGEALELVQVPVSPVGAPPPGERVAPTLSPPEEVYRALALGIRDYWLKNGASGAVVGLSGGIDSSLTAAIAAEALGGENVLGVLMPSEYTAQESIDYALRLSATLGLETLTLPITDAYEALLKALDPVFTGTDWGIAEENLQSRVRGILLMAISNKTGRWVLSTGNKSEIATGYSTLYGDMSGGYAVLKDVPKTLVYEVARWCNRDREVIPQEVLDRLPTAELRAGQLDTDLLPPYELLDPVLEAYIEDAAGADEIGREGFAEDLVRRVIGMVDRAEYKRRQAPPGVKVTLRAFGRDRRLPITNRYHPSG
ncbi:MAG: NAD+ synthase [Actinomycetota bacterium]